MINNSGAAKGSKKGNLSMVAEDSVKWRLFDETVNRAREAFALVPDDQLRDLIDEAVLKVREEKSRNVRRRSRR
jgi:hypothetical protein